MPFSFELSPEDMALALPCVRAIAARMKRAKASQMQQAVLRAASALEALAPVLVPGIQEVTLDDQTFAVFALAVDANAHGGARPTPPALVALAQRLRAAEAKGSHDCSPQGAA